MAAARGWRCNGGGTGMALQFRAVKHCCLPHPPQSDMVASVSDQVILIACCSDLRCCLSTDFFLLICVTGCAAATGAHGVPQRRGRQQQRAYGPRRPQPLHQEARGYVCTGWSEKRWQHLLRQQYFANVRAATDLLRVWGLNRCFILHPQVLPRPRVFEDSVCPARL